MSFDRDLATELLELDDRDIARFFAGRETEVRAFEAAVRSAGTKPQATFRIFQGAPGCGKTSLAHHLAETCSDKVLFVPCEPDDLTDAACLSDRIERAAIERGGGISRAMAAAAETAGARLGARPLADAALRAVAGFATGDATVVLHLDEAHARAPAAGERLVDLHTTGIGVPCVVMMTGLEHTSLRVADIRGLSRLASSAVVDMGAMKESECAASTAKMLNALNVSGEPAEMASMARLTGKLAHEWPQHLHCAQSALCEELMRTDGVLKDVNTELVRARSDELRHGYYERRLEYPIFRIDTSVTQQILVDVSIARPSSKTRIQLRKLCEAAIDRAGLSGEPEFQELPRGAFSTALIEKGIVSGASGKWDVAIPSMADWAVNEIGAELPRRDTQAGLARQPIASGGPRQVLP